MSQSRLSRYPAACINVIDAALVGFVSGVEGLGTEVEVAAVHAGPGQVAGKPVDDHASTERPVDRPEIGVAVVAELSARAHVAGKTGPTPVH